MTRRLQNQFQIYIVSNQDFIIHKFRSITNHYNTTVDVNPAPLDDLAAAQCWGFHLAPRKGRAGICLWWFEWLGGVTTKWIISESCWWIISRALLVKDALISRYPTESICSVINQIKENRFWPSAEWFFCSFLMLFMSAPFCCVYSARIPEQPHSLTTADFGHSTATMFCLILSRPIGSFPTGTIIVTARPISGNNNHPDMSVLSCVMGFAHAQAQDRAPYARSNGSSLSHYDLPL